MSTPIYHITHLNNLPAIVAAGGLQSDRLLQQNSDNTVIGFDHIKRRRLDKIHVDCHPGTTVGDYVPFYFCPRSVMLYVIYRQNPSLQFHGGQREIVHLVSTLDAAIEAASGRPWAFSDGNAGAQYTKFYADLARVSEILDWEAISARDWHDPALKNRKQAEFLVHETFPWRAFHEIGVVDEDTASRVRVMLRDAARAPRVVAHPDWYY